MEVDYNKQSPSTQRVGNTQTDDGGVDILPELPPMYAVVILNDDVTPMHFVVKILEQLFHFGRRDAVSLMMTVHTKGRGSCGKFSLEIARTKTQEVVRAARAQNHPLRCITEELD